MIGYFATWEDVSNCIHRSHQWNGQNVTWCRHSTPSFRPTKLANSKKTNKSNSLTNPFIASVKKLNNNKNRKDTNPRNGKAKGDPPVPPRHTNTLDRKNIIKLFETYLDNYLLAEI